MSFFGVEVLNMKGDVIARTEISKDPGPHSIGDGHTFEIPEIIPGKRNGQETTKALKGKFYPPLSDGREQRFSFNGASEVVPAIADNTLGGGRYRVRFTLQTDADKSGNGSF